MPATSDPDAPRRELIKLVARLLSGATDVIVQIDLAQGTAALARDLDAAELRAALLELNQLLRSAGQAMGMPIEVPAVAGGK
jgi:hypothetical protein